jgi:hypothetical protein
VKSGIAEIGRCAPAVFHHTFRFKGLHWCRTGLRDKPDYHAAPGAPKSGITVFLQNGGSLEAAQDIAITPTAHNEVYDRRKDLATLSEIEHRIAFEYE